MSDIQNPDPDRHGEPALPAHTPEPPYYAVIFTSLRTNSGNGYDAMAQKMVELASSQPGFLGVESARGQDGLGITVSYWSDQDSIAKWRAHPDHQVAQKLGRETWYSQFSLRVARVEKAWAFTPSPSATEPQ